MENLSVVIIALNGEKTLPRLLRSLEGVEDRVVLDTGSTDKTVEIAKSFGCNVIEVGDKFRLKPPKGAVAKWKKEYGYAPAFKHGKGYFHFAKARNYAATFAKNDWIFQPDVDEEVEWDLERVREAIQDADHLVYRFCYAYREDGTCGLEFTHSKFYRKSMLEWKGWVHETHIPKKGKTPRQPKFVDFIYHKHFQHKSDERSSRISGLELSVLADPTYERNIYYLAREYFYRGQYDKAIQWFEKAVELAKWSPEKAQAHIFWGLSHKFKGEHGLAIKHLHEAMQVSDARRDAFWELGMLYKEMGQPERAVIYLEAALAVPFKTQGYINSMELYRHKIPNNLAGIYSRMENKERAKKFWIEALANNPPREVYPNLEWFYGEVPLVSIVVPTVRPKGYKRLVASIKKNTVYSNYEIIKKGGKGMVVEKFNQGVKESHGDYIVYLADDTEVEMGWLTQAFVCFKENFRDRGLVILNDRHWEGTMANHFLCSKNIREELDGEIWSPAYHHCGVDVELYCRLKAKNLIEFCENARITHHHYFAPSRGATRDKEDKYTDIIHKYMKSDRRILSERLLMLGLTEDAKKHDKWFLDMYGEPVTDNPLAGDADGPERAVVGKATPVPPYEKLRYEWASKNATGKTVLDIGCSSGFGSRFFEGFDYTGVDYDSAIIEYAKLQYGRKGVSFVHADINEFDLKFYDNIVIFECVEHLANGKELIQKLKKHCNRLFATVPYKEPVGAWGKYHLIHNLSEVDFPDFEYKWMRPDGKIYNEPGKVGFNLMYMMWKKGGDIK